MPPQPPASFASAAASTGAGEGAVGGGRMGGNSGDWSRPRTNGATATFRRSSQATSSASARDFSSQNPAPVQAPVASSNVYVPPHATSAYLSRPSLSDLKYSKDQLLEIFRNLPPMDEGTNGLPDVLTEGWVPGTPTTAGSAGWSRRDDPKEAHIGPDVCWDTSASVKPLGLIDMDGEERELFLSSVNSPLKPPPQNPKEGTATTGINGRKSSVSQVTAGHGGSLQSGRPGARRRDTSDAASTNLLASPTAFNRPMRDDGPISTPPPSLMRRRTDFKDMGSAEKKIDTGLDTTASPFGSFKRTNTGPLSASINGPQSPWATATPASAGFSAFGNFAIDQPGQPATPGEKKLGFGSVGASRFKGLMSKESSEDIGSRSKEKSGPSLLEMLGENEDDGLGSRWGQGPNQNIGQYGERVGSAALGGDDSSPQRTFSGMEQRRTQEEIGFTSLGREAGSQETPQSKLMGRHFTDSPTGTNPYQSPEGGISQEAPMDNEEDPNPYASRGDRSQTGSVNQNRTFSGLQGFGNLGLGGSAGWSGAPGPIGATGRVSGTGFSQGGYGDSVFGPMGDVSSPGGFGSQSNAFGAIGRGSGRMSSLFPNQMQDQMRNDHGLGDIGQGKGGLGAFGAPVRDTDSPSRTTRGPLDDLFGGFDNRARTGPGVSSPFAQEPLPRPDSGAPSAQQAPSASGNTAAGNSSPGSQNQDPQMPAAQKRQMVMPDRMRWIYRDPTGQTQGPWSGLEMHDWYKAGFFSPELLVKKQEDPEYEPLAQLIRRIGNSREPFLVPQIGIPHGPPTAPPGGQSFLAGAAPQTGSAQPPFPSSFPSFGTTLTAQQQNDLERRKQEEQYLMARQKENLAAHQAMIKNMQMSGMHNPHALNHHSSAQSLHSQPSYGSITSPGGYQQSPAQIGGPHGSGMPGFFDRPGQPFGGLPGETFSPRESDLVPGLDRLSLGRSGQSPFGRVGPPSQDASHQQQVTSMLQDKARLEREQHQQQVELPADANEVESMERLEQFQQLRNQETLATSQGVIGQPAQEKGESDLPPPSADIVSEIKEDPIAQIMGIPSAKTEHIVQPQQIVAPAPSISPLPAPAAQRNRQHVAETLVADSRSRSQTPSIDTPTAALAPWAKEPTEATKGPSLKEIQEAESRKAAQLEEAAARQRQQIAERERILAAQAQETVVGLPSGANWAAPSPTAASSSPAWAKKAAVPTTASASKKTLAQIQKEEEARKNRAVAAAAAAAAAASAANTVSTASPSGTSGGKRYADLASKVTSPSGPVVAGAWTTVGASGKAKMPMSPSTATPQRTLSGSVATTISSASKPKAPTLVRANTANTSTQHAQDEFQKWAKLALGKGLNSGINVDEFVRSLMVLPAEPEMLSDAVYASSQTLDGRRFAEEFIRRRRNADKGIAPEVNAGSAFAPGINDKNSGGGWSEVAKKGPAAQQAAASAAQDKDAGNGDFKVVAAKKKGKR